MRMVVVMMRGVRRGRGRGTIEVSGSVSVDFSDLFSGPRPCGAAGLGWVIGCLCVHAGCCV